jgi:asparagine synthase (glutamine-hydrolysing)
VAVDGRLDEPEELAARLGIEPGTESDDSLISLAWTRWGPECLDYIYGEFALAACHTGSGKSFLARDASAARPLRYAFMGQSLAFASMPDGIRALGLGTRANLPFLADVLLDRFHMPEDTELEGIQQVRSGELIEITGRKVCRSWWWNPSLQVRRQPFREEVEDYGTQLDAAVRRRLAPQLAAQLSSGWDSSSVVATAARLCAPGAGPLALTAAPRAGFAGEVPRGRMADESPLAAEVAQMHGLRHSILRGTPSPWDAIRNLTPLIQRPLLSVPNNAWWHALQRRALDAGKNVMLTGEIGNHSLHAGGLASLPEHLRQSGLLGWARQARAATRDGRARWRGVLANSFGHHAPQSAWDAMLIYGQRTTLMERVSFVRRELREQSFARAPLRFRPTGYFAADRLRAIRGSDPGLSRKAALAQGLEERDPMSDRRLIEWSLGLAPERLLDMGEWRPLARAGLTDRLPQSLLNARLRGLQAADWYENLRSEDAATSLEEVAGSSTVQELLDLPALRAAISDWPTGGWSEDRTAATYRLGLLNALAVAHFIRWAETPLA